jgi:hypothetical protein
MFSTTVLLRSILGTAGRYRRTVIFLTLSAALCRGQSVAIGLSSGAAAAGSSITLNLSLSTATSLPAALQWTLAYSTADFGAATIAAGPATTSANKQLSCSSSAGSATCILWGLNDTTVSTGVLATVSLPINHTTDSSSQLQLASSAAADSSGSSLGTSATGGTVTIQPGLSGFTCTPVAFAAPATSSCTITLTAPALAGGTAVALTASPASAVTLPASVTIPQGAQSGTFSVTAGNVTATTAVMLTASSLGVSQGFGLTVNPPPPPQITSLSPNSATVGTPVTITGTNFGTIQGSSKVTFNGTVAAPSSWSATSIVVPVPAGATSGNVPVTVGGVASNAVAFSVQSPIVAPVISSLNPASATAGTPVTITGTNFGATQGASTVTFNGTAATPSSWSATSIVVPVPATATSGNVVVTVGGVASNGVAFTLTRTVALVGLSVNPQTVVGGQSATGTVTLSAPASVSVSVTLSASGHYTVAGVPVLVKVPIVSTSATFPITTRNARKTTPVTVTATYGGVVKQAILTVQSGN